MEDELIQMARNKSSPKIQTQIGEGNPPDELIQMPRNKSSPKIHV